MQTNLFAPSSTVLLTTPERFGLFSSVLGAGIDVRLDPDETCPLHDFLCNCAGSGGSLVVLDEAHFIDGAAMARGLGAYLDDAAVPAGSLSFMVVCSQRAPGDSLLAYIAAYCGVYDIICDCDGAALTSALSHLLGSPNTRHDVVDLIAGDLFWDLALRQGEQVLHGAGGSLPACGGQLGHEPSSSYAVPGGPGDALAFGDMENDEGEAAGFDGNSQTMTFDLSNKEKISIRIEIARK